MKLVRLTACVALALVAAGCGGSSTSPTPTSPTAPTTPTTPTPPVATTTVAYSGLFASGLFTGSVTMTAQVPVSSAGSLANIATLSASATGTAKFSGASNTTINLTGTYDTVTGKFTLSTAGWTVQVTVVDGVASGTISTPVGAGSVAALQTTESNPVVNYCGSYSGTESGKFLVTIRNGLASGVAAENGLPGGVTLAGTASGNTVTLSWSWTEGSGGRGTAIGTINGTSLSGTWTNTDNQSGTWSGNAGC
jgi:hypothetical protein